jgi:UDP-N-acetylmuramyl pentapeptide phosphotransferase/UDP-N-acetylglucosamine-1-phosphate transferase
VRPKASGRGAIAAFFLLGWPSVSVSLGSQWQFTIPAVISFTVLFLWIAGYTNAFNFMDGINGIAAGQAVVTGVGMALLSSVASSQGSVVSGQTSEVSTSLSGSLWSSGQTAGVSPPVLLSVIVAGAAAGFLPHNFPRARMFMGDVGSAPLGFILAVLVIWLARDHGGWLLIPLALLHANFVLDTAITLGRRVLRGERWYEAHKEHFYQRLVRAGKSHTFVTLFEMGLQVVVLGLMLLYVVSTVPVRIALALMVLLIWAGFFVYCEREFRRVQIRVQAVGQSGTALAGIGQR